jgi:hypothetical protein
LGFKPLQKKVLVEDTKATLAYSDSSEVLKEVIISGQNSSSTILSPEMSPTNHQLVP